MLLDPVRQIIRNADVQNTMTTDREDIDEKSCHGREPLGQRL
jgi:hypothetical protein